MPIHDWTRVEAGIFHDFHHAWIEEIKRALNRGLLPPDHYALAEQIAGGLGPDVLTLKGPSKGGSPDNPPAGSIALAEAPPRVRYRVKTEVDLYAEKANVIAIRHTSRHQVIAVIEIVSPGNKNSRYGLRKFVDKALELLRGGVHLLVVDLFPPGPRDPAGIHTVLWEDHDHGDFVALADRPLTLAAYIGGTIPEAFVEPTAVGEALAEMPLFLTPDDYIPVPLETTYQSAWEAVPSYWQDVLTGPAVART